MGTESEGRRIEWIDFAKFSVMVLVICDHLGLENLLIANWIWSFHLPAFFFISGMFFKPIDGQKSLRELVKKDAYRLLLPVLLWYLIASVTWRPIDEYILHPDKAIASYLYHQVDFLEGFSMGFGWFMVALFWIRFQSYLLFLPGKLFAFFMGFVFMPAIAYVVSGFIKLPYYLINSWMAIPFYYAGYLCKDLILEKISVINRIKAFFISVILFVITIASIPVLGHVSINAVVYGNSVILFYLIGLTGIFMMLFFSYSVYTRKFRHIYVLGGAQL